MCFLLGQRVYSVSGMQTTAQLIKEPRWICKVLPFYDSASVYSARLNITTTRPRIPNPSTSHRETFHAKSYQSRARKRKQTSGKNPTSICTAKFARSGTLQPRELLSRMSHLLSKTLKNVVNPTKKSNTSGMQTLDGWMNGSKIPPSGSGFVAETLRILPPASEEAYPG